MKVLVTGSHGYVGSVVAPALIDAGHEVAGIDALFFHSCNLLPERAAVPVAHGDVRDVSVADLLGYDAVVHLAALSNDPLGDLNARWTEEINFRATVRVAEAAKAAGVGRFIFASSCSMYGTADGGGYVAEDAPLMPLTAYAATKARSEEALSRLADSFFSPVYMRFATAYGVSPRLRVDLVLNNLVAWAYTTRRVRIMSDGTPWRPLVHVEDMARAITAVLAAPRETIHDQAFNVGASSENYQVRELAEIVDEAVAGCEVEYAAGAGPDPRSYRVDFGKFARAFPRCRLTWDARAGVRELVDAFGAARFTLEDFEGDRYVRLRHLTDLAKTRAVDDDLRWTAATASTGLTP